MKQVDICYIASHGFASRMLIQTDLLGLLAKRGLKISLISPDKNDLNLKEYCEKNCIDLHEFTPEKKTWTNDYLFMRKYFLEDINKNPALLEKHIYSVRYNKSKNPWKRLRPFIYWLIYKSAKKMPIIRKLFLQYEQQFLSLATASNFLKKINPKLLIATYPISLMESMLLHNANKEKINTAIHMLSWDNITCKGYFAALANYYIAWGPIMRQELMEYYEIPSNIIFECGVPHFDEHVEIKNHPQYRDFLADLKLNPVRPYLFFAMSSPRFAPYEINIVENLAEKINNNFFGPEMQLIVRPHPQNVEGNMADLEWIPRLKNLIGERVAIDFPQLIKSNLPWSLKHTDMTRLSNLIAGSSVVINSGSTISIDALMADKPVVITSFDADKTLTYWSSARRLIDYTHLKKFISYKGVKVAYNYDEFYQSLHYYINDPKADWEERNLTRTMECGEADGKATERVASTLINILDQYNKLKTPRRYN